jgi:DNA-binding response OmpR family regulator
MTLVRVRALIIDDDADLRALLREYFFGHAVDVVEAADGEHGFELLAQAKGQSCDVVLLDVMLPGLDGFAWLPRIRRFCKTPVIMLSARGDADDRIRGLELGADDYLAKPFHPKELLLRMHAVLRRSASQPSRHAASDLLAIGALEIYVDAQAARYYGEPLLLTVFEFRILTELVKRAGTAVAREELAVALGLGAGYDSSVERSLDVHVSRLRQKLGRERGAHKAGQALQIKSIRGTGYLLARSI